MSYSDQNTDTDERRKINWYEMYILVNHWRSDLKFYRDDIRFLQQLIKKYLIWITKKENMDKVAEIRKNAHELEVTCDGLYKKVDDHLSVVVSFIEGRRDLYEEEFITIHDQLENEMAGFVQEFREEREKVFRVTEYIMDSEELQHILAS